MIKVFWSLRPFHLNSTLEMGRLFENSPIFGSLCIILIQILTFGQLSYAETSLSGIGIEGSSLLTNLENPSAEKKSSFGVVNGRIKKQSSVKGLLMAVDAQTHLGLNSSLLSDFTLHELYAEGETDDLSEDSFALGRKIVFWNQLDESFKLGRLQPIYNASPLHPVEQGLTGLLYQMNLSEGHRVYLFGSLVYLPNQGPCRRL
jgi:hypothetical protein